MHIKQISIHGFKSYRDLTALDVPFSPHHNVVVGRNGSGKSSFFWAIRFVLNDAANSSSLLSREERLAMLHDAGGGSAAFSAFVELVFDNSDNRFPTGRPETILRRTLGLSRDEYTLDEKSATRAEVMGMLEAAGFSRANPYYIVPQGRVAALCSLTDADRLSLLKDVAGTGYYELRRAEAVRIMEETAARRAAILDLMDLITARLQALESEKHVLTEFSALDRDRRCLEYALLQRELSVARSQLEETDSTRLDCDTAVAALKDQADSLRAHAASAAGAAKSLEARLACELCLLRDDVLGKLQHANRALVELGLTETNKSLESSSSNVKHKSNKVSREILDQELQMVRAQLAELQDHVTLQLRPNRAQLDQQLRDIKIELASAYTVRRKRTAKSSTSKDTRKISALQSELVNEQTQLHAQLKEAEAEAERTRAILDAGIVAAASAAAAVRKGQLDAARERVHEALDIRDQLANERKSAWQREALACDALGRASEARATLERAVFAGLDRATARGLQAVAAAVQQFGIVGVRGPVFELLRVPSEFRRAVQSVAGPSLFHVLVDSDDVAKHVLDGLAALRKNNGVAVGKVTLIPLNRIHSSTTAGALIESATAAFGSRVIPLLKQVEFDSEYHDAFAQIFGKSVVCSDINVAASVAKDHGLTAVTLQGDRVDKRGALTGGFMGAPRAAAAAAASVTMAGLGGGQQHTANAGSFGSKLDVLLEYKAAIAFCESKRNELEEIRALMASLDQQITAAYSNVQAATANVTAISSDTSNRTENVAQHKHSYEVARCEHENAVQSVKTIKERLDTVEANLAANTALLDTTDPESASLTEEASTDFLAKLLAEARISEHASSKEKEHAVLRLLETQIIELQSESARLSEKLSKTDTELAECEAKIQRHLVPREIELSAALMSGSGYDQSSLSQEENSGLLSAYGADDINTRAAKLRKTVADLETELTQIDKEIEKVRETVSVRHKEETATLQELGRTAKQVSAAEQRALQALQRRCALREQQDAAQAKIRDLGVLPEEFTKYESADTSHVIAELRRVRDSLRSYDGRVNKKANEQFATFTKQKEDLASRFTELEESATSISRLMEVLDERKDLSLERSFGMLATKFSQIWAQLVPGGRGELRLLRKNSDGSVIPVYDNQNNRNESEESEEEEEYEDDESTRRPRGRKSIKNINQKNLKRKQRRGQDKFVGVSLCVSFSSGGPAAGNDGGAEGSDTLMAMDQLSGGQKSLVALSLIFAIQKCDPAPFYLFDEIDANLDPQYRGAIARLLHSLSRDAQFITTTFRPELLEHADKFYGVTFRDKTSVIQIIDQQEAMNFVENTHEDGVAAETVA